MCRGLISSKAFGLAALLLACAPIAGAQVVVGRVVQRGTNAVIEDASVFIGDVVGSRGRTVSSSSQGKFRVKLDTAGSLVVRVRRIGFRPFESSVLRIAIGDSAIVDVQLEPVPQELTPVVINAELEAIKDIHIRGYDPRSMPATYFTASQIDAVGRDSRNYLDIMRKLRFVFVNVDDTCVHNLGVARLCVPVYLDDRLLATDPDELRATLFVVDPNTVDHIVYLRAGEAIPREFSGGALFIYTRNYTNRQRQSVKVPKGKPDSQ
ncbi:MAG: carboxypeptidase-like regulatory domain-containing protein [Gemmatimonadaceae bacterium]